MSFEQLLKIEQVTEMENKNSDDVHVRGTKEFLLSKESLETLDQASINEIEALVDISKDLNPRIEKLTDEYIYEKLNSIIEHPDDAVNVQQTITEIKEWIHTSPSNADSIQKVILAALKTNRKGTITLPIIYLLGESIQYQDISHLEIDLTMFLSQGAVLNENIKKQLLTLVQSNTFASNTIFHKISDFYISFISSAQHLSGPSFTYMNLRRFAPSLTENAHNYLVQLHAREIQDSTRGFGSYKEDILEGVEGGTDDATIYTYSHIEENHRIRSVLGIHEGDLYEQPILPIAPHYYGIYNGNFLKRIVYSQLLPEEIDEQYEKMTVRFKEVNNPHIDDSIYNEINEASIILDDDSPFKHSSKKLNALHPLNRLYDSLEQSGETFFYDTSRLSPHVHPYVRAMMVARNEDLLARQSITKEIEYVDDITFSQKLFPLENYSEDELYNYYNLSQLHMRKKIHDEFGIELSDYSLWVQRNFLQYLEQEDIQTVEVLKEWIQQYGGDFLKTFVAREGGASMDTAVLTLIAHGTNETLRPLVQELFKKYAAIVDAAEDLRTYLSNEFGKDVAPAEIEKTLQQLLDRGKRLLVSYQNRLSTSEDLASLSESIDRIKTDVVLFASAFKSLSKERALTFDQIKSTSLEMKSPIEIPTKEKIELEKIYVANRPQYSFEELQVFTKEMEDALKNEMSRFYLLKAHDQLAAFIRFEDLPNGNIYAASLNVRTEILGSGVGPAIMKQTIEEEGRHRNMEAIVREGNPMIPTYEKEFGFQIDTQNPIANYKGTGHTYYKMFRPATVQEPTPIHSEQPQKAA